MMRCVWIVILVGCTTTVAVPVVRLDGERGFGFEEWPATWWAEVVEPDGCGDLDVNYYFRRNDHCYKVGGTCTA